VLKITTTQDENKTVTVHLTGQLTGEYVAELEKALNAGSPHKIALDLSNVTFVDREAMIFLCGCKSRISIENIPSYVVRWIEQEFRCGSSYREPSKD
jgi:ABC-type transporter Mla MlaB component